jgi:hypothetical protein
MVKTLKSSRKNSPTTSDENNNAVTTPVKRMWQEEV